MPRTLTAGLGLEFADNGSVITGRLVQGNQTAAAGASLRVDALVESNSADPLAASGGIWPGGPVYVHAGFSKAFDNSQVLTSANASPFATLFAKAVNNGSNADTVAILCDSHVLQSNRTGFGLNVIARNQTGTTGTKLIGCEIDVQPAAGFPPTECGGLYINAFSEPLPGPAIYIEGIFGGKWGTGLSVGNLSDLGAGIGPAAGNPRMGTLLDSGTAQYQLAAVKLSNTHRVRFNGTASTHAEIYADSSNFWRFKLGAGAAVFRDSSDLVSLVSISGSSQAVLNVETSDGELRVANTRVVTKRQAAVTAPTGGATVDSEARTAINAIISRLQAHGLIS